MSSLRQMEFILWGARIASAVRRGIASYTGNEKWSLTPNARQMPTLLAAGVLALLATPSGAERDDRTARPCPPNALAAGAECVITVQRGATLWRISRSLAPALGMQLAEVARALQRDNPQAFMDGEAHRLKAGAMLRMPTTISLANDPAAQTTLAQAPSQQDLYQTVLSANSELGAYTGDAAAVQRESSSRALTTPSRTEGHVARLSPANSPPPLQSGSRDKPSDHRTAQHAGIPRSATWFAAVVLLSAGLSLAALHWRRGNSARLPNNTSQQERTDKSSIAQDATVAPLSRIFSPVRSGRLLSGLAAKVVPASLHRRLMSSDLAKRLARGSLWTLLGSATSRLLVLVAMVLVARELGQVQFGEFGLIQSTLGVVGLMAGLGLGATSTRFVAMYATSDPRRAGRVIALVSVVAVGTVLLAAVGLLTASGTIARTILDAPHLRSALMWGTLLMVATTFRGVQRGVLAGLERFDSIAKLDVLEGVVSLVAMFVLSRFLGVEGALLGLAISAGAVWLAGFVSLRRALSNRRIMMSYRGCWVERNILVGYGLPSVLANISSTPILWLAMTFTAHSEQGYAGLGLYNAAYQWHGPIMFIPAILTSVSIPVLVQEWEAGRVARFRKVTFSLCALMIGVAVPAVIITSLMSPWIMSLYGPGFREGWLVLVLLVAAAPLNALAKISAGALLGMNRAWSVLWVNLVCGIVLLAVTLWLVPAHGVIGLAGALLTAYGVLGALSIRLVLATSRQRIEFDRLPNPA